MQQFWFTVKKIKKTTSYEFDLADKKCKVDVELFRKILPLNQEETFQVVLDLIKSSPCYNAFLITADVPEIYMQQFWFTVKKIKKTTSYEFDLADKKCKVDVHLFRKILGICPRVPNKDFVVPLSEYLLINFLYELGYKDFQYQIDYKQSKLKRREIMPYPRFTKFVINYFLSLYKSIPKGLSSGLNTIKDGGVIQRLKFVNKGEDCQEYGQAIPNTMLTDEIKQSEAYQAFIAYSTGLIPPKKTRGKGSQGKKAAVTPKKKSLISADDNIIHKPNVALELGKSISKTEAEIAEEAKRVHETHERLVTEKPASEEDYDESEGEPANRPTGSRRTSGVVFRDTSRLSKKKSLDQFQKLKGIQMVTEEERLVANTIQAIKASRKVSKSIFITSSEGTGITPGVPDEVKGSFDAKVASAIDWGSENESNYSEEEKVYEEEIEWVSTCWN
ncbi:hypothetical protein Tco_1418614 [Tanacetum coccineum]